MILFGVNNDLLGILIQEITPHEQKKIEILRDSFSTMVVAEVNLEVTVQIQI